MPVALSQAPLIVFSTGLVWSQSIKRCLCVSILVSHISQSLVLTASLASSLSLVGKSPCATSQFLFLWFCVRVLCCMFSQLYPFISEISRLSYLSIVFWYISFFFFFSRSPVVIPISFIVFLIWSQCGNGCRVWGLVLSFSE